MHILLANMLFAQTSAFWWLQLTWSRWRGDLLPRCQNVRQAECQWNPHSVVVFLTAAGLCSPLRRVPWAHVTPGPPEGRERELIAELYKQSREQQSSWLIEWDIQRLKRKQISEWLQCHKLLHVFTQWAKAWDQDSREMGFWREGQQHIGVTGMWRPHAL